MSSPTTSPTPRATPRHDATPSRHLQIEQCDAVELVARFGSPLYVVSESALRSRIAEWVEALAMAWPNGPTRVLPSVKANTVLAVQQIVRDTGCGADTFGAGEYEITRRVGFDPATVSVNGQKTPELIERAIADGARLTVDNIDELPEIRRAAARLGRVAKVRIRVRPPLDGWDSPSDLIAEAVPTSTIMGIYKPGVPVHQLARLSPADFGDEIDLVGLHAHVARNTRDPQYWALAAREVIDIAAVVRRSLPGWVLREIDLGGGFPSQDDNVGAAIDRVREKYAHSAVPTPAEYMQVMADALRVAAVDHDFDVDGVLLSVEPGRGLFSSCGHHLATVMRRKEQVTPFQHQWIELDTSVVHFGVEESNRWETVAASQVDDTPAIIADVVGCSCQLDLMVSGATLPDLAPGDIVAFPDSGAYQETGGSNFRALRSAGCRVDPRR
ncbi:MAG: hypothetical protein R2705_05050 [Ilumatobacteraceae bacterium]